MRAAQVTRLEGPDALEVVEVKSPSELTNDGGRGLSPGHLLVETHVAGVNFPDVLLTRGEYQMRPELPFIPGSEISGVVRAAPDTSRFRPGDRVASFPGLGGFAGEVIAEESSTFHLPDDVSFEVGACLLMNYLTMHFGLKRRGGLQPGETVLVHGAAGGIGTASIQMAKAYGARVIAVASTEDKRTVALAAGADEAVAADGFRDAAKELTNGRGVDIVVDPVGGDRFTDSLRSLAVEGRLLVVGFTAGEIPTVKVNRLLLNNVSVVGVGWGAFWMRDPSYLQEQWSELMAHLSSGALNPPIGACYPLERAADALNELANRQATGKILITTR